MSLRIKAEDPESGIVAYRYTSTVGGGLAMAPAQVVDGGAWKLPSLPGLHPRSCSRTLVMTLFPAGQTADTGGGGSGVFPPSDPLRGNERGRAKRPRRYLAGARASDQAG
ncbi:MAG: hypothetical protein U5P10_08250 [Spirochaetia bacterium]|nr:hypothetical protein [Spirochaetia bacterium]